MRAHCGTHASQRGEPHAKGRTSPVSSDSPHTPEERVQASNSRALRSALSVLYCGDRSENTATPARGAGDVKRDPQDISPTIGVTAERF